LRNARAVGQGVHGLFAAAGQALEDRPTGRVGEGLENIVRHGLHVEIITIWLLVVKRLAALGCREKRNKFPVGEYYPR